MAHRVTTPDGVTLAAHLAVPQDVSSAKGLVICHGFPVGKQTKSSSGLTYPEFADELSADTGWVTASFNFRGTGSSGGDFSLDGWANDLSAIVGWMHDRPEVDEVYVVGASTGGSLAVWVAASDARIAGVATLGAPADFTHWAEDPTRLLQHAREIGLVTSSDFPVDADAWAEPLTRISALEAAAKLSPTPLLVVHGADDDVVPVADARAIAAAYGEGCELSIVKGGAHRLRHDPRGVAVLSGWLDRQAAS